MSLYLPIAEMSVSVLVFLCMGAAVGFVTGLFGVGGGFLMTPILMFLGVPPAIAVGTSAPPIIAASVSGALAQWRRKNIDTRMAIVLLVGGFVGSIVGVQLVRLLRRVGQFDFFVSACYVLFLGVIGVLMLIESGNLIRKVRSGVVTPTSRMGQHSWIHKLPFKMRFHRSKLYISTIPPLLIGAFVGLLAAVMGVGGGFIMVPAMIYMLRMPTSVVIGTSLLHITCLTILTAILNATFNQTVDVLLALILMVGGVVGAQVGTAAGGGVKPEYLRFGLACVVLMMGLRIGYGLVATPTEVFTIENSVTVE
jgi:uncharacterized protein